VDSLPLTRKNELGIRRMMLRQCCQCEAIVIRQRLALTHPLSIPAEPPVPRAAASTESP
jgi:hypothetical protein